MKYTKNIKSLNNKIVKLDNKINIINDGVVDNTISLFDEYELERNKSNNYNIIINLELFSILNGIDGSFFDNGSDYITLFDIGNSYSSNNYRRIKDLFDIYLVLPNIVENIEGNKYLIKGTIIQKVEEVTKTSFSRNQFNDEKYLITINNLVFDNVIDSSNNHINDLILFFNYKNKQRETIGSEYINEDEVILGERPLIEGNVGETIDLGYKFLDTKTNIYYDEYFFNHILLFNYKHSLTEIKTLSYIYSPIIKIEIFNYGKFYRFKEKTIADKKIDVPVYSKNENGYYFWTEVNKNLFPYMNKTNYIFYNKSLSMLPNMTHENTSQVYNELVINDIDNFYENQDPYKNFNSPC